MHLDWNLMSDKYECLSLMGDGSYGEVCKARGRDSGAIVAIKRYLEGPEGKAAVKKIAMREIRMLRQLRHENLVNLLEVVNKTGKMFLVFEFVDYTILDELNHYEAPIPHECARKYVFQVVRGIEFCHAHGIVHRDVKPENVLLSTGGVVKVCDLGFARDVPSATTRDQEMTAYVATRWYRAPELLVGDTTYRKEVDVWAIGCLHAEMVLNEPVFAGESDVAQVFLQIRALGSLPDKLVKCAKNNCKFKGREFPRDVPVRSEMLEHKYSHLDEHTLLFLQDILRMDGAERPTCSQLLQHPLFTHDGFAAEFLIELKTLVRREIEASRRMRMSARSGRDANPLSRRKVKKALHKRSHVNLSKWHQEAERKSTLNLTKERFMPPIHNATQPRMENRTSPSKQPKDAVVKATEAAKQARRDKAKEEITLPNLKETNEVVCRAASKPSKKAVPMMPHITTLAPFSSSQVSPKKLLKRVGVKPASDGDDRIEDQEWM